MLFLLMLKYIIEYQNSCNLNNYHVSACNEIDIDNECFPAFLFIFKRQDKTIKDNPSRVKIFYFEKIEIYFEINKYNIPIIKK